MSNWWHTTQHLTDMLQKHFFLKRQNVLSCRLLELKVIIVVSSGFTSLDGIPAWVPSSEHKLRLITLSLISSVYATICHWLCTLPPQLLFYMLTQHIRNFTLNFCNSLVKFPFWDTFRSWILSGQRNCFWVENVTFTWLQCFCCVHVCIWMPSWTLFKHTSKTPKRISGLSTRL